MSAFLEVIAEPLDEDAVRPYGRMIAVPKGHIADFSGEGWQCWVPLAELEDGLQWQAGLVHSAARPLLVSEMESHLERPEIVFALDRPLVQTVALPDETNLSIPDVRSVKAFVIQPGQGLFMEKGIWHGVGLPAGVEGVLYLFLLGSGELYEAGENSGWVPFAGGMVAQVKVG